MFAICFSRAILVAAGKVVKASMKSWRQVEREIDKRDDYLPKTERETLRSRTFSQELWTPFADNRRNLLRGILPRCGGAENSAQCLGIKSSEAFAVGSTRTKLFIFHGRECEWRVGGRAGEKGFRGIAEISLCGFQFVKYRCCRIDFTQHC